MTDSILTNAGIKQDLVRFYDQDAARRAGRKKNPETWKVEHRDRFTRMCMDQGAQTVLDIGAGPGRDSEHFESCGLRSYPFDLSPGMVAKCRKSSLSACRMDAHDLGFSDQTFDAVWSLNSLLHTPRAHIDTVWREIRRVMKQDALFFLGVYGGPDGEGPWDNDWHEPKRFFSFFTDDDIQSRVSRHFRILRFDRSDTGSPVLHFQGLILQQL